LHDSHDSFRTKQQHFKPPADRFFSTLKSHKVLEHPPKNCGFICQLYPGGTRTHLSAGQFWQYSSKHSLYVTLAE